MVEGEIAVFAAQIRRQLANPRQVADGNQPFFAAFQQKIEDGVGGFARIERAEGLRRLRVMRGGFLRAQGGRGVNGCCRVVRGEPLSALFGLFVADRVKRAVVAGVVAGAGVPPEDELHGRLLIRGLGYFTRQSFGAVADVGKLLQIRACSG